jgi:hypothetical protein
MVFQYLQLHKLTYNCKKFAKQKFGGFVVVVEPKSQNVIKLMRRIMRIFLLILQKLP